MYKKGMLTFVLYISCLGLDSHRFPLELITTAGTESMENPLLIFSSPFLLCACLSKLAGWVDKSICMATQGYNSKLTQRSSKGCPDMLSCSLALDLTIEIPDPKAM